MLDRIYLISYAFLREKGLLMFYSYMWIEFLFLKLKLLGKKRLRTFTVIWDRKEFIEAPAISEKPLTNFDPYIG